MGSRNWEKANRLIARRRPSHPARLVFLYMAQLASDKDQCPVYFGGWDRLAAEALALPKPDGADAPEETTRKARNSQKEMVRRAIAELEAAGLIDRWTSGRRGQRAEYGLRLHDLGPTET